MISGNIKITNNWEYITDKKNKKVKISKYFLGFIFYNKLDTSQIKEAKITSDLNNQKYILDWR